MVETDGTSPLREQLERMLNPPEDEYIQQFIDMAQARLPVAEREQNEELRIHLSEMIRYSKAAMKHFEQGKIGAGLVAIGWMHEHRAKCGLPFYKSLGVSAKQSKIAKHDRRPGLPKRVVMLAMDNGCATAEEIRNFLFNNQELNDRWGNIGIDPNDDDFEIMDYDNKNKAGDCPTKKLTSCRIPKIISELRPSD